MKVLLALSVATSSALVFGAWAMILFGLNANPYLLALLALPALAAWTILQRMEENLAAQS